MIEDKIKLINSREEVERYLKVNGISGKAKDSLLEKWEYFQLNEPEPAAEPEIEINEVKASIVDIDSIDIKEE